MIKENKETGLIEEIAQIWNRDDVTGLFREEYSEDNTPLTDLEIDNVLLALEGHASAEYGINWDCLRAEIDDVLENREEN